MAKMPYCSWQVGGGGGGGAGIKSAAIAGAVALRAIAVARARLSFFIMPLLEGSIQLDASN